jgi:hypothetical protein
MHPDHIERMVKRNARAIRALCIAIILLALCLAVQLDDYAIYNKLRYDLTHAQSERVAQPGENTITLTKEDVALMNQNYLLFRNEFALCFTSEISDGSQYYKAIRSLNVKFDGEHVHVQCPSITEMIIHSHPEGACEFSDDDKESFADSSNDYEGIICGVDEFVIVDRNNTKQSIVVI